MSAKGLVIIGGSGQGRMALQVACADGRTVAGFVDSGLEPGAEVLGLPVLAREPEDCPALQEGADWFLAIGNNRVRETLSGRVAAFTRKPPVNLVDPSAILAVGTELGTGVFIAPGAVVNIASRLEDGVILNTRASLDHDGVLEAYAQVCPGVALAGNTTVGRRGFVGTGACTIPGMTIGADAVVGAGAVVIRDVPEGATVVGVPARER